MILKSPDNHLKNLTNQRRIKLDRYYCLAPQMQGAQVDSKKEMYYDEHHNQGDNCHRDMISVFFFNSIVKIK